jgi:6-phosphogluconate dehydrogenase
MIRFEVNMPSHAEVGLIGLAVMGRNLALNIADHGFSIAVYNRTVDKVDEFLASGAAGRPVIGAKSLVEFVRLLKRPRAMILMVKAGAPVDSLIAELVPHLEAGDILIDAGNSNYIDSERRVKELEAKGLHFIASGVSGGEEGARFGPSLMPGGSSAAWPRVEAVFRAIAAKVDGGVPCCEWVGPGGAGHYVKMVHNGIEYGDMQLIAESYDLMRRGLGLGNEAMARAFAGWNSGALDSYLIEITAQILEKREQSGTFLVDTILDAAGQKGTGRWTVDAALDEGQPLTLITEAVFSRNISAMREERLRAADRLGSGVSLIPGKADTFVEHLGQALLCAKLVSYAQGFMLLRQASQSHRWDLNLGNIALLWRGGCIIRSRFLGDIHAAFLRDPNLASLLVDPHFAAVLAAGVASWRHVVAEAVRSGVAVPAFSSALAFFDSYRCDRLPANLIQAQRDFFGAHTYERVDAPRGRFFHSHWMESRGPVVETSEV